MILGISGKKGSGKNTVTNIIHGIVLKDNSLIKDWNLSQDGKLVVNTWDQNGRLGWGELQIDRTDSEYLAYAEHNMWPYVKMYSFADNLKWICTHLFNIPHECVWGTDDQKNQIQQHLRWENLPGFIDSDLYLSCLKNHYGAGLKESIKGFYPHEPGPMTAREFMQFFATQIMRKIWQPIWINSCLNKIISEQSKLAVICDVRFPDEVSAIESVGGSVIRLTRNIYEDNHCSETALDDYPFKYIIDNHGGSLDSLISTVTKMYRKLS